MSGKSTVEKKAYRKNGILRLVFIGLAVLAEIGVFWALFYIGLSPYFEIVSYAARAAAFVLVLGIYSQRKTASIRMPWIILILIFPVVGTVMYLTVGLSGSTKRMRRRFEKTDAELFPYLETGEDRLSGLERNYPSCAGISRYIASEGGYPLCSGTSVEYYPDAAEGLEAQIEAISGARSFIFMEYFAIENADSWQRIERILERKVREGVEVRVFYDDIGSVAFINYDFAERLRSLGIKCRVFNPMIPLFNLFLNNRDHRKITVVDGRIGFTGGYNIADEYFNITSPYGHWKDTGVRLEGEAVRSMTAAFLEMWNAVRADDDADTQYSAYLPGETYRTASDGYVQFYADSPIDRKPLGEDVYLSMICRAEKYVYFMTPYLIITDEMNRELGLAAKRGVDVRIITPGIPDKKIVYRLTRSYYAGLISEGVRIYEYKPGFCHAKMSVSDGIAATCGTINMDFRSFYHHFEDGCLLVGCGAVAKILEDFERTMEKCEEVTEKYRGGRNAALRLGQLVLRLFSPLL